MPSPDRPYSQLTAPDLSELARKSLGNRRVIEAIITELELRKSKAENEKRKFKGKASVLLDRLKNWRNARTSGEQQIIFDKQVVDGAADGSDGDDEEDHEEPPAAKPDVEPARSAPNRSSQILLGATKMQPVADGTLTSEAVPDDPQASTGQAPPPQAANQQSFQSRPAKSSLEISRQSLLDTRSNNPLINCPILLHSNSWNGGGERRGSGRIRVLGTPDRVIARLVNKSDDARIYALDPEVLKAWRNEGRRANATAGAENDAGLRQPPETILKHLNDGHIALECDIEQAQANLAKMKKTQDTCEREIGDSAMFLVFGCIHWPIRDSTGNNKFLVSPLLVLPVNITRATSSQGGRPIYSITHAGDGLQDNQSLLVKFFEEHGVRLPEWDSDQFPDLRAYITRLEQLIKDVQGARIHGSMALGQFHFANYRMWKDLDAREWGGHTPPGQHTLVAHLLSNTQIPNFQKYDHRVAEEHAGVHQADQDLPIITDCDSSQYHTVMRVIAGDSLVTIGPPGTGKSQTIVNAIACLMAAGKSVLFVAQKSAALKVVYERLQKENLGAQVLPIYSKDATSRKIMDRLSLAHRARLQRERQPVKPKAPAHRLRQLNAYADVLARGHDAGEKISNVVRKGAVADEKITKRWAGFLTARPNLDLGSIPLQASWWEERQAILRRWSMAAANASQVWISWTPDPEAHKHLVEIRDGIRRACDACSVLSNLLASAGAPAETTLSDVERIAEQIQGLSDLVALPAHYQALLNILQATAAGHAREVDDLHRSVATWHALRDKSSRILGDVDVTERDQLQAIETATTILSPLVTHHESIGTARNRLQVRRAIAEAVQRMQDVGGREPAGLEAIAGTKDWEWSTVDLTAEQKPSAHQTTEPALLVGLCHHLAEQPERLHVVAEQATVLTQLKTAEDAYRARKIPLDRLPNENVARLSEALARLRDGIPGSTHVDRLAPIAEPVRSTADLARQVIDHATEWMENPAAATPKQLNAITRLADERALLRSPEVLDALVTAWSKGISLERITGLTQTLTVMAQAREAAAAFLVQFENPDITSQALADANAKVIPCLGMLNGTTEHTVASLTTITQRITAFLHEWDATVPSVGDWADRVGIGRPATKSAFAKLAKVQLLLAQRVVIVEGASAQRLADPVQADRLTAVKAKIENLQRERASLDKDMRVDAITSVAEIKSLHDEWTAYRATFLRLIPFTRRSLKERIRNVNRGHIPTDAEWAQRVKRLEAHFTAVHEITSDATPRAILGSAWQGLATAWGVVGDMQAWATALRAEVGDLVDLDQLLGQAPATRSADALMGQCDQIATIPGLTPNALVHPDDVILGSIRNRLDRALQSLTTGVTALTTVGYPTGGTISAWRNGIQATENRDRTAGGLDATQSDYPGLNLMSVAVSAWTATCTWLKTWEECGLHRPGILTTAARISGPSSTFPRFTDAIRGFFRGIAALPVGDNGRPGGALITTARTIGDLVTTLTATAEALQTIPTLIAALPLGHDLTLTQLTAQSASYAEVLTARERLASLTAVVGRPLTGDDLGPVTDTIEWVKQVRAAGATKTLIIWMSTTNTAERMAWWRALTGEAAKVKGLVLAAQRDGALPVAATLNATPINQWLKENEVIQDKGAAALDVILRHLRNPKATAQEIVAAISNLREQHAIAARLEPWTEPLGRKAISIDPVVIAAHERFAQAALQLPTWLARWLLTSYSPAKVQTAHALKEDLATANHAVNSAVQSLAFYGRNHAGGPLRTLAWTGTVADLGLAAAVLREGLPGFASHIEAADLESAAGKIKLGDLLKPAKRVLVVRALDQRLQLKDTRPWPDGLAIVGSVTAEEITRVRALWSVVESGSFAGLLTELFDWTVDVRLAELVIAQHPELEGFIAPDHEQCREKFAEADKTVVGQNATYVRNTVLNRTIDPGTGTGKTSDWTGGKLLEKQMGLQNKSMRPRQIIQQAGDAMQGYCPCWLMTPSAVAQFLAPGKITFDVVIFDEASQIPPAEAWGAMARAKQVVLVGDPKQMPPSNWFKGNHGGDDDDDDDLAAQEPAQESILEQALEVFPSSMLRWHYRSLHHSLIAPANEFSYGGNLLIFPHTVTKSDELGIGWHPITGGTFQSKRNIPEAQAIVDWLEPRLLEQAKITAGARHTHGTSYGVLTMNLPQQEQIEDLLAQRGRQNPDLARYLAEEEDRLAEGRAGFCVKNLENYQGDERDIIVLSFTYGPDKPRGQSGEWTGKKLFSSVNGSAGKRRFNVMITRARKRMEVFSSVFPGDMPVTTEASAGSGVADMGRFLEYAQTGILPDFGHSTGRGYDSDFEEAVHRFLQERGYDLEPQVGVAEYRIDLALRHPRDPSRFILAIECDGRLYHSSRSARDRDRLREHVLRDRGWTFYRIWSTDWFQNPTGAKERLLAAVKKAVETCV